MGLAYDFDLDTGNYQCGELDRWSRWVGERRLYYQFDDDRDYQLFLSAEFCGSTNGHFTLIAAIIGFFPYNFYPATIFLGDTGALF